MSLRPVLSVRPILIPVRFHPSSSKRFITNCTSCLGYSYYRKIQRQRQQLKNNHSTISSQKRSFQTSQSPSKKKQETDTSTLWLPPKPLSSDKAELPGGYIFYPLHNDKLDTPPKMTHIHSSTIIAPPLPRLSVFDYLFPPKLKGKQPIYYQKTNPEGIAFIDGVTGEEIGREKLGLLCRSIGSGIKSTGAKKGSVALIFGFNSLLYVKAVLGCQAAGIIVSPANAAYAPSELLHQFTDSTASTILIEPKLLPVLHEAIKLSKSSDRSLDIPDRRIILLCKSVDKPTDSPHPSIEEFESSRPMEPKRLSHGDEALPAYLCYSSGTTGRAKGVETTHHNLTSQCQALQKSYEKLYPHKDVILGILPMSHIYGLILLIHQPLTVGVPVVILPRFEELSALDAIQKYRITWALVVPPILIVLLHSKNLQNYDLSSLRGFMSGAAPLSSDLAIAVQNKLDITVTQGYGLTETSPVISVMTLQESEGQGLKGKIGKLMSTYQARLVDDNGKDVGINERGELWVRGPSVMRGYWKNPEATKNTFAEGGWFKTGDVAIMDENGYLAIVDRVKELIKYKGFQVPPAELEALLLTHPEVADVGVIPIQSESQGTELPRAYVVPIKGLQSFKNQQEKDEFSNKLIKWVEGKVANHKRLRGGVILIQAIPKSPSGKILRKDLRALAKKEQEEEQKQQQHEDVKKGRVAKL